MFFQYCLKCLYFVLTAVCCLLISALIFVLIGGITMGLYSIGSILFSGYLNTINALYISTDVGFILGGGISVAVVLFCYCDIYNYFTQSVCCFNQDESCLNQIPMDDAQHSDISADKRHSLEGNDEFECPICYNSVLHDHTNSQKVEPVTLRHKQQGRPHDEQTYHKTCLLDWIKSGGQREPVLGVNLFQPRGSIVRYYGYNKVQRDAYRASKLNNPPSGKSVKKT